MEANSGLGAHPSKQAHCKHGNKRDSKIVHKPTVSMAIRGTETRPLEELGTVCKCCRAACKTGREGTPQVSGMDLGLSGDIGIGVTLSIGALLAGCHSACAKTQGSTIHSL